jgi:hypothetical protein
MSGSSRGGVPAELFDMGRLGRQLVHPSRMPETGIRVAALDSAYSDSDTADNSVLMGGIVQTEDVPRPTLWLADCSFGKWPPERTPKEVAFFFKEFRPQRIVGERVNGSCYLEVLCRQEFAALGINPRISWFSARAAQEKAYRIGKLVRLSREDRLRIITGPWVDTFLRECESFTGLSKNKCRQDSLIDCASMLCRFVGSF